MDSGEIDFEPLCESDNNLVKPLSEKDDIVVISSLSDIPDAILGSLPEGFIEKSKITLDQKIQTYEKYLSSKNDLKRYRSLDDYLYYFNYDNVGSSFQLEPIIYIAKEYEKVFLDFGCGEGNFVSDLREKDIKAWGVELDSKFESKYTKIIEEGRIPFEPNYFDICTSVHVIEYVIEKLETISELFRVIKPNGSIYFGGYRGDKMIVNALDQEKSVECSLGYFLKSLIGYDFRVFLNYPMASYEDRLENHLIIDSCLGNVENKNNFIDYLDEIVSQFNLIDFKFVEDEKNDVYMTKPIYEIPDELFSRLFPKI